MIAADQALEQLIQGNRRFVTRIAAGAAARTEVRVTELIKEHRPIAIVLGCSDARVPAEIIFDQNLGDLFVIRVAGNIVAPSQIGSIEFATSRFGTKLVVVLGHSDCGAIQATIDELLQPAEGHSDNLKSIVSRIRPAVEELLQTELRHDLSTLTKLATRANIKVSINHLRNGSRILENLILDHGLKIVGAEYSLETGCVHFLEEF